MAGSTLSNVITTKSPLVWINTDEPRRVIEFFINHADSREVYRFDLGEGLQVYNRDSNVWVTILGDDPPEDEEGNIGIPGPIDDPGEALQYVVKAQGIYLLENAHLVTERLVGFLSWVGNRWIDKIYTDDADNMGATIVMISCKDDVPPEITRNAAKISYELPTYSELGEMLDFIAKSASITVDDSSRHKIIRSAQGLSEYEFISAALESLVETNKSGPAHFDSDHISSIKISQISKGGNLEIRSPSVTLDDVGGLDNAKAILEMNARIWNNPDESSDVEPLSRVILLGVAGCMTGAHLITTDKGIIPLSDLVKHDLDVNVVGLHNEVTVCSDRYDKGLQPTIKVSAYGHDVCVTPWHPLMTLASNGEYVWKRADEVKIGDRIAISRGADLWGNCIDISGFVPLSKSYRPLTIPKELTPALAELLGSIIADADIDRNQVRIHNGRDGIPERLTSLVEEVFGFTPRRNKSAHTITTEINSRVVVEFLQYLGLKNNSIDKVIPAAIMGAPREIVVAFLRGIFHDSNVSDNNIFKFSSASKVVSDFVSSALLNLGIFCRRNTKFSDGRAIDRLPNPSYQVIVSSSVEAKLLLEAITFNKTEVRTGLQEMADKTYNTNLDTLPLSALVDEALASVEESVNAQYGNVFYNYRSKYAAQSLSYVTLRQLFDATNNVLIRSKIETILNDHYIWAPVSIIEDTGMQHTYDLTVPNGECYVASGVVSHNTGKSLLAEASAAGLGLDLATFNVSAMMSKYVGESEANMRNAFKQIAALAPIVLWTDEIGRDFSGGASSGSVDGGTTDRVHGTLLTGLQELPKGVFWVGAANNLSALPPEMLRAGRIDQLLFVGFPTLEERESIVRIHLGKSWEEYDIATIARHTPMFTGAEIKTLIKHVRFYVRGQDLRAPTTMDFCRAVPDMKNRVWRLRREEIVKMYRQAMEEWTWASSAQENEAPLVLEAAKAETKTKRASLTKGTSGSLADLAK